MKLPERYERAGSRSLDEVHPDYPDSLVCYSGLGSEQAAFFLPVNICCANRAFYGDFSRTGARACSEPNSGYCLRKFFPKHPSYQRGWVKTKSY